MVNMNKEIKANESNCLVVNTFFNFNILSVVSLQISLDSSQTNNNCSFDNASNVSVFKKTSKGMKIKDILNEEKSRKANSLISINSLNTDTTIQDSNSKHSAKKQARINSKSKSRFISSFFSNKDF